MCCSLFLRLNFKKGVNTDKSVWIQLILLVVNYEWKNGKTKAYSNNKSLPQVAVVFTRRTGLRIDPIKIYKNLLPIFPDLNLLANYYWNSIVTRIDLSNEHDLD